MYVYQAGYIISSIIKPWGFQPTYLESLFCPFSTQVEELELHLTDLTHCCASPGACLVVAWQVGHALEFKGDLSRAGSMDQTAMRKQTFHLEVTVRLWLWSFFFSGKKLQIWVYLKMVYHWNQWFIINFPIQTVGGTTHVHVRTVLGWLDLLERGLVVWLGVLFLNFFFCR